MLTVEHNTDNKIPEGKKSTEFGIDIKIPFWKGLWRLITRQHYHIRFQIWSKEKFEQGDIRMNIYHVLPESLTKIVKKVNKKDK